MSNYPVAKYTNGVHNRLPVWEIPNDSAQDELNWVTVDGGVVLSTGKQIMGTEGTVGEIRNMWFGTRNDNTKVLYVKYGSNIGYWNGTAIVAVVTGLTSNADYSFQNYTSTAGNFTYATGVDGIYKFHNASLGSFISLYDSTKNFKGKALIDKGRMLIGGTATDTTGLYGSKIDPQGSNYTLVSAEVLGTGNGVQTTFTGTLAFKVGDPLRNCFNLRITQGSNAINDNYSGIIVGPNVTIGTINYITGAFSITFTTPPPNAQSITCNYQWEQSNSGGITDFTKSATRLAGEGFIIRQDEGGDAIQRIVIGTDGAYYSAKQSSFYRLVIDNTDLKIDNQVFRKDIGIAYYQTVVSTGGGIIFMNTANPDKPELTKLDKNPLGDSLIPTILFPHFKFENYYHDQGVVDTWGRYIVVMCRNKTNATNDVLLLCDPQAGTVDITGFGMKCMAKDSGVLYAGSPFSYTLWKLFQNYDDDGYVLTNFWMGKSDDLTLQDLKKTRHLFIQGLIDGSQKIEVYVGYDDATPTLVGTILGTGDYVDASNPSSVGGSEVGGEAIGGSTLITVYPYYIDIKLKPPKFETRTIMLKATGLGYASMQSCTDHDILRFENRAPKRFRLKQNVSLNGGQTNLPNPQF